MTSVVKIVGRLMLALALWNFVSHEELHRAEWIEAELPAPIARVTA